MKSIAEQNAEELGGARSVLSRQRADHIRLYDLLDKLTAAPPERARPLLIRIYRLVFPHAFAEETVLWPVIRRALPDGHELTRQVEAEHQRINELVARLEQLAPGVEEWRLLLNQIVPLLRQDVRDEEDILLPRLQQALGPDRMRLLGTKWAFVRAIAPTRSHPVVSRRPPGNVWAALPLSILDRARDYVELRRYGRPSAVSRTLARASHAVERLPPMKSGEDRVTRVDNGSSFGWKTGALIIGLAGTGLLLRRRAHARA